MTSLGLSWSEAVWKSCDCGTTTRVQPARAPALNAAPTWLLPPQPTPGAEAPKLAFEVENACL